MEERLKKIRPNFTQGGYLGAAHENLTFVLTFCPITVDYGTVRVAKAIEDMITYRTLQ